MGLVVSRDEEDDSNDFGERAGIPRNWATAHFLPYTVPETVRSPLGCHLGLCVLTTFHLSRHLQAMGNFFSLFNI